MKKILYVICGNTASGKSAIAVKLAKEMDGEVLSCDSVQFYRRMDIGSAKLREEEREGIPHHGLDIAEIGENFNVAKYVTYAQSTLDEIFSRGKNAFIVGGSGFYLKSFYGSVIDGIPISSQTKDFVQKLHNDRGIEGVKEELLRFQDSLPEALLANPVRAMHALERCIESQCSIAEMLTVLRKKNGPFDAIPKCTIHVQCPPFALEERLQRRIDKMFRLGFIQEVRQLMTCGIEKNVTLRRAVGYGEVIDFLQKKLSEENLKERIFLHTRQLVRKQRTWFRHQIPIHITYDSEMEDIHSLLRKISHWTHENYS
ncbi:MAG: tRNA (adenosine(37)-N6)-dimethylallyltransferase MiaA [Puniceicoccales bacterium]|jgi:tRNA dimethylallyltransferase|nr:tRNA (adenosine(37)-N6)-dimethylallyltransferase MiaA [Puniceicoccales bacterium]